MRKTMNRSARWPNIRTGAALLPRCRRRVWRIICRDTARCRDHLPLTTWRWLRGGGSFRFV